MSENDTTPIASDQLRALRDFLHHYAAHCRAGGADENARIDGYLAGIEATDVFTVTAAIDSLLRRHLTDLELSCELRAHGLPFPPAGRDGTVRGWLRDVRHRLAQ